MISLQRPSLTVASRCTIGVCNCCLVTVHSKVTCLYLLIRLTEASRCTVGVCNCCVSTVHILPRQSVRVQICVHMFFFKAVHFSFIYITRQIHLPSITPMNYLIPFVKIKEFILFKVHPSNVLYNFGNFS